VFIDRISDPDHLPPLRLVRDAIAEGHHLRGAVIALGNFDGFHRGHRHLIGRAQQIAAGRRPVAVMSVEPHPRQFFGVPGMQRIALPAQKHVFGRILGLDYIFEPSFDRAFAGQSPEEFVAGILHRSLGVSHVVTGADFRFGAGRRGDVETLERLAAPLGIRVEAVSLLEDYSSSSIRAALADGDLRSAGRALGRFWEAAVTCEADEVRLADQVVRPTPGSYTVADPIQGNTFEVRVDGSGRLRGLAATLERVVFLTASP